MTTCSTSAQWFLEKLWDLLQKRVGRRDLSASSGFMFLFLFLWALLLHVQESVGEAHQQNSDWGWDGWKGKNIIRVTLDLAPWNVKLVRKEILQHFFRWGATFGSLSQSLWKPCLLWWMRELKMNHQHPQHLNWVPKLGGTSRALCKGLPVSHGSKQKSNQNHLGFMQP